MPTCDEVPETEFEFIYVFIIYLTAYCQKLELYNVEWKVVGEWWIGKDVEGSDPGLTLRHDH
jgi:hypothetical protein